MTTTAIRHRSSSKRHLVKVVTDNHSITFCGEWYSHGTTVEVDAEWFGICHECRCLRAARAGKRTYETPVLRKNRPTDGKKLRRELRALEERRKLERFTGNVR